MTSNTLVRRGRTAAGTRKRRTAGDWALLAVTVVGAVIVFSPFGLILLNAFKSSQDYSGNGPLAFPTSFTVQAFADYLGRVDYGQALWNSV
ncbi:MAG: carbohydrate ABC transporter permease, partial [Arthrobacter sp.]|nr:carbohydrate ABC transporter permease [Arthrobacter sp.]